MAEAKDDHEGDDGVAKAAEVEGKADAVPRLSTASDINSVYNKVSRRVKRVRFKLKYVLNGVILIEGLCIAPELKSMFDTRQNHSYVEKINVEQNKIAKKIVAEGPPGRLIAQAVVCQEKLQKCYPAYQSGRFYRLDERKDRVCKSRRSQAGRNVCLVYYGLRLVAINTFDTTIAQYKNCLGKVHQCYVNIK